MVTLVILDGFGYSRKTYGNAIKSAGTPFLDKLKKEFPHTTIEASGEAVGLTNGQMGNSEVGHLNLGAGRVVYQDLTKIDRDIKSKDFFKNPQLIKALKHAEKNKSTLHLMGLLSDGGVHSHITHLKAILDATKDYKIKEIAIHAFMDGRDTLKDSGISFIENIERYISGSNAKIVSIMGRVYAMDREKRYDRVEKAYNALVYECQNKFDNPIEYMRSCYKKNQYDEFLEPAISNKPSFIKDNDSIIFYNFRTDRARELTEAISQDSFKEFKTKKLKNLMFTTMTEYDANFKNINIINPPVKIEDNLSAIISKYNKKQFHVTETTKYAHVTFFFNGGIEEPYNGEDRKLIDSIDTKDFSKFPKMRAEEITNEAIKAIESKKYDFILINYSNPDMIGHTGNYKATEKAVKCVDKLSYKVCQATLKANGDCIICADHGNAEMMLDKLGNVITSHSTNPVPFILASDRYKNKKLKNNCKLANVAPTVLKLLNLEKPQTMEDDIIKL